MQVDKLKNMQSVSQQSSGAYCLSIAKKTILKEALVRVGALLRKLLMLYTLGIFSARWSFSRDFIRNHT